MGKNLITVDPDDDSEMARDLALDRAGRIATLKDQLKSALVSYRIALPSDTPGGAQIAAYLRPNLAMKAALCNDLAAQLKALDPSMPEWEPLPDGTNHRKENQ